MFQLYDSVYAQYYRDVAQRFFFAVTDSFLMCTTFIVLTGTLLIYFAVTALLSKLMSLLSDFRRTFGRQLLDECLWVDISVFDGFSLLIGNHCSSLNTDNETIEQYFKSLGDNLTPPPIVFMLLS
jgi:hypothetical protein